MSFFNIDVPDGRTIVVEGDDEPTDEEVEEILKSLPKISEKDANGFKPSVVRNMQAMLNAISKKLDEPEQEQKQPIIKVSPPVVNVAAPNVTVKHETPKIWDIEVTSWNEAGRIKTLTIKARK